MSGGYHSPYLAMFDVGTFVLVSRTRTVRKVRKFRKFISGSFASYCATRYMLDKTSIYGLSHSHNKGPSAPLQGKKVKTIHWLRQEAMKPIGAVSGKSVKEQSLSKLSMAQVFRLQI